MKMRKASWIWMVAALAVASFGCKKEEPVAESTPPAQPAAAQPPAAAPAETTPAPAQPTPAASEAPPVVPKSGFDRALLRPAMLGEIAPDTYQVKFSTTRGDFTVTVTRSWAPIGADRFYNLVKHHFYDNASVFRVVPSFVAQFGISAYPPVSAAWQHADIKDDPVTQRNKRGTLTFATAGPNTRTTQIFINLKDNGDSLDSQGFSPFGVVDGKGMNIVDMFYDQYGDAAGPDQDQITRQGKPYLDKGWPKLDSIKSATLVGK
jgi:peptidyl-prolyl cis-trans isomerase A (cyclophilin A)